MTESIDEQFAYLINLVAKHTDVYIGEKYMPLYEYNECHKNCYEFTQKNTNFNVVSGWLIVDNIKDSDTVVLLYHSMIMKKGGDTLIDITKRRDDKYRNGFLLDHDGIPNKPNYLISKKEGLLTLSSYSSEQCRILRNDNEAITLKVKDIYRFFRS